MTEIPSISYTRISYALQLVGWIVYRKRGSHWRLQKHEGDEVLKITIPAHRPVKRITLAKILEQARIDPDRFLEML